ncbi:hypothetical protein BDZ89DRAFT_132177 [Hymenopellis radicata]|nr:hypothetical protein BDZ89DRAFT_132177 [Hymenopellis radicata]
MLDEITQHLRVIYVGRIAYEYMHTPSKSELLWFSHHLESSQTTPPLLDKRSEPGRTAALDTLFSSAARASMSNIILAMPHRGRLNLESSCRRSNIRSKDGVRDASAPIRSRALPAKKTPWGRHLWKALHAVTEQMDPYVNLCKLLFANGLKHVRQRRRVD